MPGSGWTTRLRDRRQGERLRRCRRCRNDGAVPADHGKVFNTKPWLGKHVAIMGTLDRTQAASVAATEFYVNVASLRVAP